MCMCMHVCSHTYLYACTFACMYACLHACICVDTKKYGPRNSAVGARVPTALLILPMLTTIIAFILILTAKINKYLWRCVRSTMFSNNTS